ncbi:hypothetical protein LTR56_022275 [Elasticomyces elasticus]|nr:hypothetical protein LTR56_022275 [Elasticomyces elasticus]KAK4908284.1 hypothetical protein LTR49_022804 [Elasticomyces elasticus]KAK5734799.1 hypothetical protein LTS12_026621 [Elasticomyces elasticus]
MIQLALKLEAAMTLYCARWSKAEEDSHNLRDDELNAQGWEELHHFEELFKPFHIVTKRVEGHPSNGVYRAEYYDYTDHSRHCHAAVALQPCKRFNWFEENWLNNKAGKREVADAKTVVKKLLQLHLAKRSPIELSPVKPHAPPPTTSQRDDNMSEDENYTRAFGSYTTPPAAAKQKDIERVAELDNLMKANIALAIEYEDEPLR